MTITLDGSSGITTPGLTNTGNETVVNLTTTGNTILGDASTDTLNVANGGLIKDASGNLGLGVTPNAWIPSAKAFQISSVGSVSANSNSIDVSLNRYVNSSGNSTYISSAAASLYEQYNGGHYWFTAASGTAGNPITFTQAMTLDASGNLALGATSAASLGAGYTVFDNRGSTGAGQYFGNATNFGQMYANSTATYIGSATALPFVLQTGGTERARIDTSGNLLVGVTTFAAAVNANFMIYGGGSEYIGHTSGTASGTQYLDFRYNGSQIGSITQNGTTGVLYNLTSDYRLKNNQQPLTGAKEFVMALQPKKWQWWDGSGEGVGFIAHEFMEVAKYSGNGEKDAVDENGNPIYQSIQPSSSEVMANLVSLLQEQQAIIEALRADVELLKGKV